jgi:chemotaxis protein CheD
MDHVEGQFEVFLQPGEYYFGDRDTRIRTLLGSCVSFTAWHPKLRVGAMCHYMLPGRRGRVADLDGRYGDEAVLWFFREAAKNGTNPEDYEIKIFGGGDMFDRVVGAKHSIGKLNAILGLEMLQSLGHRIVARHVGGSGHRHVIFDVGSGDVWCRYVPLKNNKTEKAATA